VVDVAECSSVVVSGAEDVPPACFAEGSGIRLLRWDTGSFYKLPFRVWV